MQQILRVLGVESHGDPVLHHLAPLGLAAAAGTALVVDLDPEAPAYPSAVTVASLLEDGLRRSDLTPARSGVAVVGHGGRGAGEAAALVADLAAGWPALVVRQGRARLEVPTVPVRALLPGPLAPRERRPAAYQAVLPASVAPGPGLLLPPLRRSQVGRMLAGRIEPRWRWVRAWERAWRLPWP